MPQESELEPGTQVGEYVIEGPLGSGAFGAVYRAVHPVIGKAAAVKVLGSKYSSDPEVVSRFLWEARVVNQIRHPNIVDIFSFGQLADGRQYHIMELLDGDPLDVFAAANGGRLAPATVVAVLEPLARALDAAHAQGIIHRDLKPANVFMASDPDGGHTPKLLDFGIAKLLGEDQQDRHKTATGTAVGTPDYMSPEQCESRAIDHRSDIYALGCMAFRLLTGHSVFEADSVVALLMAHISSPPTSPSALAPDLPAAVDGPVLAMLAKDPDDRPSSATAAIAALESVVEAGTSSGGLKRGVPLEVASVSSLNSIPAPTSRQPPFVAAGAVGLAVAMVGYLVWALPGQSGQVVVASAVADASARDARPAAAAPSATVEIRFTGVPDGTTVLDASGATLTTSGRPLTLPRGAGALELTFTKPGYETAKRTVVPDQSRVLDVTMSKTPKPRTRRRQKPSPAKVTAPAEPAPGPGKNDVESPY